MRRNQLAHVPCYFCGSSAFAPYLEENGYALVRCDMCRLLYVTPRPSTISARSVIGGHERTDPYLRMRGFSRRRSREMAELLGEMFPYELTADASWLDIGAGAGELLTAAKAISDDAARLVGVEADMNRAKIARRRGFEVTFFRPDTHADAYDVVSAIDLFQHFPSPREVLRSWTHLVKPGGALLLRTMDTTDLEPFEHPRPLSLPEHLCFANADIISSILNELGLTVQKVHHSPLIDWHPMLAVKEAIKMVVPGQTSKLTHYGVTRQPIQVTVLARRP